MWLKNLEERNIELPKNMKIVLMDEADDRDGYIGFDAIFEKGKKLVAENSKYYNEFLNVEINPDDCSVIIFTSGTSGLAKGVMLSQHNICFVVMSNSSVADIHPGDVHLSILPIYHTFECSLDIVAPLYNGCCIAFNDSLLHLMRNFQEVKPTVLMTVPLMLEKFHGKIMQAVSEQKGGKLKLTFGKILAASTNAVGVNMNDKIFEEITKNFGGRLRLIIIGAAAVRPDVIKDFKTFGITSYIGYGLTECAPLVSCNYDALFTTDTVGRPIPGIEVKLINEDAQGVGEICVKGPNVMLGYYKDEEQTREVLDEYGWFHTGDLGFVGEDGLLRINGRIKNVIVTKNGKNIYAGGNRTYEKAVAFGEKYGIGKVYTDYNEMFTDPEVDVIYITTPHNTHKKFMRQAIENGKHILVEKSITLNSDELNEMAALAEEKHVIIGEAMTIYHMPIYKKLKELLETGVLGKVNLITMNFGSFKEYDMNNRFFNRNLAGGAMLDIGVYALSFIRWFMDSKPDQILSQVKAAPTGVDEQAGLLLMNPEGQMATVMLSLHSKQPKKGMISCEKGYIEIMEYPRAWEARITYVETGDTEVVRAGENADALAYELADMEKAIAGDEECMHFEYTKDVMDMMTGVRNFKYPEEM